MTQAFFMRTAKTLIRLGGAQADLSLRWAHMPFCWFCHVAAQIKIGQGIDYITAVNKLDKIIGVKNDWI